MGQALISGQSPTARFGNPGVLRAVIGSRLSLAALGLLGAALGTLLRHPPAATAVIAAVVFVLPGIAAFRLRFVRRCPPAINSFECFNDGRQSRSAIA
jgi:hypothetical protein